MNNKLVLIDRDGVINVELSGYVTKPEELNIMNQAKEALKLLHEKNFICVVITNQSVVGRGIISQNQLDEIHNFMMQEIANYGGKITEVLSCTDHPNQATNRRKPGSLMLQEALIKYNANPQETAFIGDAITDMKAALGAGCKRFLVKTGKGEKSISEITDELQPVEIFNNILEAAQKL
jgi:D-glycero-D-manno-heptose 1,7-bisphosphate phosphatase